MPRYKPCDGSTDTERFFCYSTEEFTSEVLKEAREKEKTRKAEAKATAKAKAQAKAKAKAAGRKTKKEKEEEKKALEAEAKRRRKERKQQKKRQAGPGPAERYSSLFSQGTLGADYSRAGVVQWEKSKKNRADWRKTAREVGAEETKRKGTWTWVRRICIGAQLASIIVAICDVHCVGDLSWNGIW